MNVSSPADSQTDILKHINTIYFSAITCAWRMRSWRSQWASEKCLTYQGILVQETACIWKICKNAASQHSCWPRRSCVDKGLSMSLCACCLRKYHNAHLGPSDKSQLLRDVKANKWLSHISSPVWRRVVGLPSTSVPLSTALAAQTWMNCPTFSSFLLFPSTPPPSPSPPPFPLQPLSHGLWYFLSLSSPFKNLSSKISDKW